MKILNPSSIAVIGASNNRDKVGFSLIENLKKFNGKVFPINLDETEILGFKCYKNVKEIKENIDLAIIAIPAKNVAKVLEECGKKKIKDVIIISAGFSEIGNKKDEDKLLNIAKKYKIRILGPNCFGVVNPYLNLDTTFAKSTPYKGSVAFISQSGAIWSGIADYSLKENFGFSGFVSLGNMADLEFSDFIEYFNDDVNTKVIVLYIETLKNGKKFMESCKNSNKRIIAVKSGISEKGKEATLSHTGSLAGEYEIYKAAFKQSNVILANDITNAFDLAKFYINQDIKGKRVVIISNAGGPASLATDYCSEKNLDLVDLPKVKFDFLWNKRNPIDLIGDAKSDKFKKIFDFLKDKNFYDSVLVIVTPQKMTDVKEIAKEILRFKNESRKTVVTCFMGYDAIQEAKEILEENNIPCFFEIKRAVDLL
ncbi:MAG: CoA-binding protein [Candidatus Woesearchaeota archaeon]